MKAPLVVLALLASAQLAEAQPMPEIPVYDVDGHCRAVANLGGTYSEDLFQACFDMEQGAYDGLKPRWTALPATMQRHCDRVARLGQVGSYDLLSACIQMEETAARSNERRQFRR